MKKSYSMLAAGSLLLFSACSNEDDAPQGKVIDSSVQELVFQVASSGDGLTTRAGRPLYSSEAAQSINNVKVVIRDAANKVVYTTEITDWNSRSQPYATGGHGKQYTLSLKGVDKLAPGTYKVTAYGYVDNSTDYDFAPASIAKNDVVTGDISATLKSGKVDAEEVFAGELTGLTVDSNNAFEITTGGATAIVTLHRQIAGSFGYFDHIPTMVDGKPVKYIRLVSVGKNTKVTFNNFNSSFTTSDNGVKYVVNGSTPYTAGSVFANTTAAHEIYTIKIADWFPNGDNGGATGGTGIANGLYDLDDSWAVPSAMTGVKFKKGSVFSGKYLIPFNRSGTHATLELQLLTETAGAPGAIVKYWNINLPAGDAQLGGSTGLTGETASSYSIVRNHLYSIGAKTNANPNDPDNPTAPDIEQPENLSKGQDLTLKVNDNWEMLHRLVID